MLFLVLLTTTLGILLVNLSCSARSQDPKAPCEVRLRIIDGCKQQWEVANHKTTNDLPTWEDIRVLMTIS